MNDSLVISELFYSLQGEGQTMGIPAIFLRLSGCNLLCRGKGWECDTIEVWRKGTATNFNLVFTTDLMFRLHEGAHLVLTGGEPLLHQEKVTKFLKWFSATYAFLPIIEIETNGTIIPNEYLLRTVDYWNCSPKLSTSGESVENRINEMALSTIRDSGRKFCFKFVISEEGDVLEAINDFGFLNPKHFVFMPAGETQDKLNVIRPLVAQHCINLGIRYCDRLHIVIWNQKTGV